MPIETRQLLKELMAIPSPSEDEIVLCNFIYQLLLGLGFDQVEKIPVDEGGYCIYAKIGDPKVTLQAHLDNVSPYIGFSQETQGQTGPVHAS